MSLSNFTGSRPGRRPPGDPELRERDERLESLKAVTGRLAHDFNNFLAPTYGYLTLLKDEIPSGSTAALYVNSMDTASQRAEAYISSILLGMRPNRHFSPRAFDLAALVEESVATWKAETPLGTEVTVRAELEPFTFYGDEKQWRTLLEQLLANARYALAIGGQLKVSLKRANLSSSEVQRLGLGTDEVFCLRVEDTGFGMDAEVARRAFEPFFTTRTQVKTAGLGLTLVHGVALFHGGQVELQSAEDQGTTVTIWIPAHRPVLAEKAGGLPEPIKPISRRKVLLIADDPLIKEVLRGWLAGHELETETAADEAEARKALQRMGAGCVLVISETDLKIGPGEPLYTNLSGLIPGAAWVFLSAQRRPTFGPIDSGEEPLVMNKPFSHKVFSDVVRKYTSR